MEVDTETLRLEQSEAYQVEDLLSGARYIWRGARNYVELDPAVCPAHVFRVQKRARREQDFDYFM